MKEFLAQTGLLNCKPDNEDAAYLRAAQAYMLISMPTGTSTIFGVFQAIAVSLPIARRDFASSSMSKLTRSSILAPRNFDTARHKNVTSLQCEDPEPNSLSLGKTIVEGVAGTADGADRVRLPAQVQQLP